MLNRFHLSSLMYKQEGVKDKASRAKLVHVLGVGLLTIQYYSVFFFKKAKLILKAFKS